MNEEAPDDGYMTPETLLLQLCINDDPFLYYYCDLLARGSTDPQDLAHKLESSMRDQLDGIKDKFFSMIIDAGLCRVNWMDISIGYYDFHGWKH